MISWDSQNRPKCPNHLHIRQEAAALDIKRQCGGFLYAENRIKRFFKTFLSGQMPFDLFQYRLWYLYFRNKKC
jgi:hypothetical protein